MPAEVERVVVISDIHMGADNGRGIFTAKKELAQFIEHLTSSQERIDLVILGDALDYLQIEPYLDFTRATAAAKTQAIVGNNQEVFTSLQGFMSSDKRIRWCIGNHDIELLFPDVQKIVETALLPHGANDGRLSWELEGERIERIDYPLSDGRKVRLVHGNKYDSWNEVDYNEATKIAEVGGSAQFSYPSGSKLVANVINPLKKAGFRHVDLLKPEDKVALKLTAALWPEEWHKHVANGLLHLAESKKGSPRKWVNKYFKREVPTFGSGDSRDLAAAPTVEEMLVRAMRFGFTDADDITQVGKDIMSILEDPARARQVAEAWKKSPEGTFDDNWAKRFASSLLRSAAHGSNLELNPWSTEKPDELDQYVRKTLGDEVVVVIAGHTHLARAVSYENGYYINTGTWANLSKARSLTNTRSHCGSISRNPRLHLQNFDHFNDSRMRMSICARVAANHFGPSCENG